MFERTVHLSTDSLSRIICRHTKQFLVRERSHCRTTSVWKTSAAATVKQPSISRYCVTWIHLYTIVASDYSSSAMFCPPTPCERWMTLVYTTHSQPTLCTTDFQISLAFP